MFTALGKRIGAATACLAALLLSPALGLTAQTPGLVLDSKIPLGEVRGRIDHLAVDLTRERLFVAELGNDTVGVLDLKEQRVERTLKGFREPQGIAYEPSTDSV